MKKNKFLFTLFIIICFSACKVKIEKNDNLNGVFWIPENSIITSPIFKKHTHVIKAPDGYVYLGTSKDGKIIKSNQPDIIMGCLCTEKKGTCGIEYDNNNNAYCGLATIDCGPCFMLVETKNEEIISGGFINPSIGISFMQEGENLPYIFDEVLKVDEFREEFNNFLLQFYPTLEAIPECEIKGDKMIAPVDFEFVAINAFNRSAIVLLPNLKAPEKAIKGKEYMCSCIQQSTSGHLQYCPPRFRGYWSCQPNPCELCGPALIVYDVSANDQVISTTIVFKPFIY